MTTDNINNTRTMKILALETDDFFRVFLHDSLLIFANKNVSFTFTSAVKETLDVLKTNLQEKPDIIFLGLTAPMESGGRVEMLAGFEVLKKVKADKDLQNIPVIIFSKYNEERLKKKAKELGAVKYLVKGECMPKDIADVVGKAKLLNDAMPIKEKKNFFSKVFKW